MSLHEKAATLAGRNGHADPSAPMAEAVKSVPFEDVLPDLGIPELGDAGPELVPVHVAWLRVRAQIKKIGKGDKVSAGAGGNYSFRGIDRALNAFGPATLLHGVNVVPVKVEASYRDTTTSQNKPTRECTVLVTYRIYGPKGDWFEAQAAGECLDNGDKGTTKAQSTALRTLLLNTGLVPTGDPDPEMLQVERGEAAVRSPQSYMAEILDESTSERRLWQIVQELKAHKQFGALVTNERGVDEPIGALVDRIGQARFAPKPAAPIAQGPACGRCGESGHHPDACPTLDRATV